MLLATLLLVIVGGAISIFLSAVASGSHMRQRESDPALESALALRRLSTLAPGLRCVLLARGNQAVVWLSDAIPSWSVHLSEAGLILYDPDEQELVFETVSRDAVYEDRSLEREYAKGGYEGVIDTFATLRGRGLLSRQIIAEGLTSVEFAPAAGTPGAATARFEVTDFDVTATIRPTEVEEPLR